MPKAFFKIFILFLALVAVNARLFIQDARANERSYHRLFILGDPHLPGNETAAKERVIRNINSVRDRLFYFQRDESFLQLHADWLA